MRWKPLGHVLPTGLTQARLSLHWAAQLVSAPGTTLLPKADDYGHTNLAWDASLGLLAGRPVGEAPLRAALVFEGLELVVLEGERERASMRLGGRTLDEALTWLGNQIAEDPEALELPSHDMPSHPVGDGGVFPDASADARAELAAWYADASSLIVEAVGGYRAASPVRCWPHHFDVASLITLEGGGPSEKARTIGVGLSPGDSSYDQPYFYVTPWPYPDPDALPALERGAAWHTKGFTAAVFTGERVVSSPPGAQPRAIHRALEEAIAACKALLGD